MEKLLGEDVFHALNEACDIKTIKEIRLRINKKICVCTIKGEFTLPFFATESYINRLVDISTQFSKYAYESEISNGFVYYEGGIRIGLIGDGKLSSYNALAYRKIYSLCIRIPHNIQIFPINIDEYVSPCENTLIISPPGCGKTTLLREFARKAGSFYNTLIIDERYELCGQDLFFPMGKKCDVIQGIPKKFVYENIIRTMSPEVVVCDEIFGKDDEEAVAKIVKSGVKCIATRHAFFEKDVDEEFLSIFRLIICLTSIPTVGSISSIKRR